MSHLSIYFPNSGSTTSSGSAGLTDIQRKTLALASGTLPSLTPVDFNSPGAGWSSDGPSFTFSSVSEFLTTGQVFVGGELQYGGINSGTTNDYYPVMSSGTISQIGFTFRLPTNTIVSIWKFTKV